jgi:hypothetical protein
MTVSPAANAFDVAIVSARTAKNIARFMLVS